MYILLSLPNTSPTDWSFYKMNDLLVRLISDKESKTCMSIYMI